MTTLQMNAEFFRTMSLIAEDETLMSKAMKYLKKLAAKKTDPTLMTKEEFFANLDEAEEQYRRGEYTEMLPGENLAQHLRRCGYDI